MQYTMHTENYIVDAVGQMNISGNIVPNNWFYHILRNTGKPNLLAISILSEIVYWYRPTEIRDEISGLTIGYKKKFKGDCLQKSYEQFGNKFGEGKQTVKRAFDCLENIGVIKRELRTIKVGAENKPHNNVMFIHLCPDVLNYITFSMPDNSDPKSENNDYDPDDTDYTPVDKSDDTLPSNLGGGSPQICSEAPLRFVDTNTKNTTETTYRDYSNHIYHAVPNKKPAMDMMDEIELNRELISENIDYDALVSDHASETDKEQIHEIYELICDTVNMTDGVVRIGGQNKPFQVVKSVFYKLNRYHIEYVLDSLRTTTTEIKNIRSYILTALYHSVQTFQIHLSQQLRHDLGS